MNSWRSDLRYKKGVDEDLDIKWGKYKMKRIFTGDAWDKALTQRELIFWERSGEKRGLHHGS